MLYSKSPTQGVDTSTTPQDTLLVKNRFIFSGLNQKCVLLVFFIEMNHHPVSVVS